jgi:hypothetical protein
VGVVKKTVAIHPVMDAFVRKTWATLIEAGYDATYSTALNFMLLTAVLEVSEKGISEKVMKILQSFLKDEKTIEELNLVDQASNIIEKLMKEIIKTVAEKK